VILTENKKFNLRFDSRQSRTGHPQSKILATPMGLSISIEIGDLVEWR